MTYPAATPIAASSGTETPSPDTDEPAALQAWASDPGGALDASSRHLFSTLYRELRRLAARELHNGGGWDAMSATTLVHETFLNVVRRERPVFTDHNQFLGYAARTMRGLIVDHLRARGAQKRGSGFSMVTLDTHIGDSIGDPDAIIEVADLMEDLARIDADLAQVVDLRFFCGFSFNDIATMRGCSTRTVQRHWEGARILLRRLLHDGIAPG